MLLGIALILLPFEIGFGIWAATTHNNYIAAGLLAAVVGTLMEAANGVNNGKIEPPPD